MVSMKELDAKKHDAKKLANLDNAKKSRANLCSLQTTSILLKDLLPGIQPAKDLNVLLY